MGIIQSDTVWGTKMDHGPHGVSLTRSMRTAREKAILRGKGRHGGAVIVFDRDKLARVFGRRLQPIDVLNIRGALPFNGSEFEERVAGDLTDASGFISRIILTDPAAFADYEAAVPSMRRLFSFVRSRE